MITANLTVNKLKSDWEKLQTLPLFSEQDKDYPALNVSYWAHNGLQLRSLSWIKKDAKTWWERTFLQPGIVHETLDYKSATQFLRWFRYLPLSPTGRIVAIEEWLNHESKSDHKCRIAVFDTITGIKITGPLVDGLKSVAEIEPVQAEIEAGLPRMEAVQGDATNPSA